MGISNKMDLKEPGGSLGAPNLRKLKQGDVNNLNRLTATEMNLVIIKISQLKEAQGQVDSAQNNTRPPQEPRPIFLNLFYKVEQEGHF